MTLAPRPADVHHYAISSRHGCTTLAALFSPKPLEPFAFMDVRNGGCYVGVGP